MILRKITPALTLLVLAGCMDREIPTAADGALLDIATLSTTLTVETLDDDGPGSLRQTIRNAANGHNITFAPSLAGRTIQVDSQLVIGKSLTIVGPAGGITISGGGATRVFRVNDVFSVVFDNLAISNGHAGPISDFGPGGGGILSFGNLTLRNSSVTGSWAGFAGGAIEQLGGSLTLLGSTIAGNGFDHATGEATVWGGGLRAITAAVSIVNSTISSNTAGNGGGGGILNNRSTVAITHSTIADNGASRGGGILNWGESTRDAVTTLVNSIVASNFAGASSQGPDIHNVSVGSVDPEQFVDLSASHSLVSDATGHNLTSAGDNLIGVDPGFEIDGLGKPVLADNGGPTKTHALLETSPAIDGADRSVCTAHPVNAVDQRGVARPQGDECDMGAFELIGAVASPPPATITELTINAAGTVDKKTGAAVVTGTMTCSDAGVVDLQVDLTQQQKQRRLSHQVVGSAIVSVICEGTTSWAAGVNGSNGVFVNGSAYAAAEATTAVSTEEAAGGVQLFWSK